MFQKLLNSLRGHTVEIHNLDKVYAGFPEGTGPDLERLRRACDEKLETWVDPNSMFVLGNIA